MKEIKFKEFVEGLDSKLDSLHGNKGANIYDLVCQYGYTEDKDEIDTLKNLELKLGESLWHIDKGGSALDSLISSLNPEDFGEKNGIKFVEFEQDVRVYILRKEAWGYETYMNVRRVILPPKKTIEAKKERIYIFYWSGAHYKLPLLKYPSSIKDLMKWMKQKKLIKAKPSEIELWNKNIEVTKKEEIYDISDPAPRKPKGVRDIPKTWGVNQHLPMRNIKTESELKAYNEWLLNEHKTWIRDVYNPYMKKEHWSGKGINPDSIVELKPIEIKITQNTVDQFISDYNNKFKIER